MYFWGGIGIINARIPGTSTCIYSEGYHIGHPDVWIIYPNKKNLEVWWYSHRWILCALWVVFGCVVKFREAGLIAWYISHCRERVIWLVGEMGSPVGVWRTWRGGCLWSRWILDGARGAIVLVGDRGKIDQSIPGIIMISTGNLRLLVRYMVPIWIVSLHLITSDFKVCPD